MQRENADSVSGRTTGNSFSMLTHIMGLGKPPSFLRTSVKICEGL